MTRTIEDTVGAWDGDYDESIILPNSLHRFSEAVWKVFFKPENIPGIPRALARGVVAGGIHLYEVSGIDHVLQSVSPKGSPLERIRVWDYHKNIQRKARALEGIDAAIYETEVVPTLEINDAFLYTIAKIREYVNDRSEYDPSVEPWTYPRPFRITTRNDEGLVRKFLDAPLATTPNGKYLGEYVKVDTHHKLKRNFFPGFYQKVPQTEMATPDQHTNRTLLQHHGIDPIVIGNRFTRDNGHFDGGIELGEHAHELFKYLQQRVETGKIQNGAGEFVEYMDIIGKDIHDPDVVTALLVDNGTKRALYHNNVVFGDNEENKIMGSAAGLMINVQEPWWIGSNQWHHRLDRSATQAVDHYIRQQQSLSHVSQ